MMWLGTSPRSWMMYSPRSVSTGSMPFCREMLVQPDLLGDHRLALGGGLAPDAAADVEDDVARILRRLGEMHVPAGCRHARLVGLQVEVEMVERVVLDGARLLAQLLELRQRGGRLRRASR